ncbi:hypothetical protein [Pseudomonas glycinae]
MVAADNGTATASSISGLMDITNNLNDFKLGDAFASRWFGMITMTRTW